MEFHAFHLIEARSSEPIKSRQAKPVVDPAADGIDEDKSVAGRATPPTWDGVMTGKFHIRICALPNPSSKGAKLFGDNGPRRFSSIDTSDWVITELGARYFNLGGGLLTKGK